MASRRCRSRRAWRAPRESRARAWAVARGLDELLGKLPSGKQKAAEQAAQRAAAQAADYY